MFFLTKQCKRLITGIECHTDYFGALGYEYAPFGIYAVTQLGFGQGSEHVYSWVFEGGYFYYGHMDILFSCQS